MKKRRAAVTRKTNETEIKISLVIDGSGKRTINTPIGFLNHMLSLFAKHGLFDLNIKAIGDTNLYNDEHHVVEDIGILLGDAFRKALGDKKGIARFGFFILPMDEVIATVVTDLSGRSAFRMRCQFSREKVGDLATEMVHDFWNAFAQNAKINLQLKIENGKNDHHIIEAIFKSCAKAMRMACEYDLRNINNVPSTKGVL